MKVSLLTAASKEYWPLIQAMAHTKSEYCFKHGYQFSLRVHSSTPSICRFEREQFMLDELDRCDWLFFMGSDAMITNMNTKVESIIQAYSGSDFIIGLDIFGINNDVFLLKNVPEAKTFLKYILDNLKNFKDDQEVMKHYLRTIKELKTSVIPQRVFNSYPEWMYGRNWKQGEWVKGDFVLHLPGLPLDQRLSIAREILPQIIR